MAKNSDETVTISSEGKSFTFTTDELSRAHAALVDPGQLSMFPDGDTTSYMKQSVATFKSQIYVLDEKIKKQKKKVSKLDPESVVAKEQEKLGDLENERERISALVLGMETTIEHYTNEKEVDYAE